MSEDGTRGLLDGIGQALLQYGYTRSDDDGFGGVEFAAVFSTRRIMMVRNVCCAVRVPEEVTNVEGFKELQGRIRDELTRRYAKFPYFKELGTSVVYLCGDGQYDAIAGHEKELKDKTGFHMNVMLGSCVVDMRTRAFVNTMTWGLFCSGKLLRAVFDAVERWSVKADRDSATTSQ